MRKPGRLGASSKDKIGKKKPGGRNPFSGAGTSSQGGVAKQWKVQGITLRRPALKDVFDRGRQRKEWWGKTTANKLTRSQGYLLPSEANPKDVVTGSGTDERSRARARWFYNPCKRGNPLPLFLHSKG